MIKPAPGLHATRFVGKILSSKLVEHKKFGLIFYFGLPFRQRNATPRTIVSYNRPL